MLELVLIFTFVPGWIIAVWIALCILAAINSREPRQRMGLPHPVDPERWLKRAARREAAIDRIEAAMRERGEL